jgi:hypothetical protein
MTDLKRELAQKIKRGETQVRILSHRVHYPFKSEIVSPYNESINVSEKNMKSPGTTVNSFMEWSNPRTVYIGDKPKVKKMHKAIDDLSVAIELEDYDAVKVAQDLMDKIESE